MSPRLAGLPRYPHSCNLALKQYSAIATKLTWAWMLNILKSSAKSTSPLWNDVPYFGAHKRYKKILEICEKYGVILIEDCCEFHSTQYQGKKVGNFDPMTSFSFYFGHHVSTIEGGMVVTDDKIYIS